MIGYSTSSDEDLTALTVELILLHVEIYPLGKYIWVNMVVEGDIHKRLDACCQMKSLPFRAKGEDRNFVHAEV